MYYPSLHVIEHSRKLFSLSAWSRILSLRDLGEKQKSPLGLGWGLFCLREGTLEVLSQDDGSSALLASPFICIFGVFMLTC